MLTANPCPMCGEAVHFIIERLPYRYTDIAVIHCQSCGHTEGAPGLYGERWADRAIERWNSTGARA